MFFLLIRDLVKMKKAFYERRIVYKYLTKINVVTQNEIQTNKIFTWLILNSFVSWPQ